MSFYPIHGVNVAELSKRVCAVAQEHPDEEGPDAGYEGEDGDCPHSLLRVPQRHKWPLGPFFGVLDIFVQPIGGGVASSWM